MMLVCFQGIAFNADQGWSFNLKRSIVQHYNNEKP